MIPARIAGSEGVLHVESSGRELTDLEICDSPKLNPSLRFAILLGFPELRGDESRWLAWTVMPQLVS